MRFRVRLPKVRYGPVRALLVTYLRGFIDECGDNGKRSMETSYIVDREAAIPTTWGFVDASYNRCRKVSAFRIGPGAFHHRHKHTFIAQSQRDRCHRRHRPHQWHIRGASCTCCKLLRLLCRSTRLNSMADGADNLQMQNRSSVRGLLYSTLPCISSPSQAAYPLHTEQHQVLLHAVLPCSEW
jgi:hypothetical protein